MGLVSLKNTREKPTIVLSATQTRKSESSFSIKEVRYASERSPPLKVFRLLVYGAGIQFPKKLSDLFQVGGRGSSDYHILECISYF